MERFTNETSQKEISPTNKRAQLIIDQTQEASGWVLCDFDGNILDADIDRFDMQSKDIVGLNFSDFIEGEELEGALAFLQNVKQEGIASGVQHIKLINGEERSYEYKDVAVYEGSEAVAVRIFVRDITEKIKNKRSPEMNEERYQGVFENTGLPTVIVEESLLISMVNLKFEALTGYTKTEIEEKMNLSRFIGEESKQFLLNRLNDRNNDNSSEYECRITSRSGVTHDMIVRLGNILNTRQMIVSFTDITSRKETEKELEESKKRLEQQRLRDQKALKQSEDRYRMIIENVLDFIFIHDLEGNFIENNARYVTEVGARPEIIAKSNVRDLMPEPFRPEFETYLKRIRKKGHDEGVIAIQTPEEGIRLLEYKNFLIYDEAGLPTSVLGSARDITEHIRDKKALKESKQRYQMIIETVGDYIFEVDLNGSFTFVNSALIKESGYTKEELLGMNFRDYTYPEEREMIKAFFYQTLSSRETGKSLQHRVIRKDGSPLYLDLTVSLIENEDEIPIGFRGISRDITEQKLAETLLQKMHDELEEKVEERTKEIQEVNIALEVLLKKRDKDKKSFEDKVAYSIREVLTPHLELLKKTNLDKHQRIYLEILEDNFREIASPFMSMHSENIKKMTRTEIQVINLIKQNKITKEIADLLGVSTRTVETHRDNIRKKLGIKNKKVNLRSFLLSTNDNK